MTKIYLVVFRNEEENIYDFEVFTNKKKAEQYKRYWDAKMKYDQRFKGDTTIIVENRINNLYYTKAANEAEMEIFEF